MKNAITCDYIKEYLSKHEYTCELVSTEYVNCDADLVFKCECGSEFYASWHNIRKMYGLCKECSNLRRRKTLQAHQRRSDDLYGEGQYVINDISGGRFNVTHSECGNSFYIRKDHFWGGQGCKFCNAKKRDTHALSNKEFLHRVSKYCADYEFISDYKNNRTSVLIKCKKCGKIFSRIPSHIFDQGLSCPQCNRSNGEISIEAYLKNKRIKYISQHRFTGCRRGKPLSFDFYLPDYNICIEYQGQQHYAPVAVFGGEFAFKRQQQCDSVKREYCTQNGVELLEIPFWDFKNIDRILDDLLNLRIAAHTEEVV